MNACFVQIVRVMRIEAHSLQRHISADIVINAFYAVLFHKGLREANIRQNCNFRELRYARVRESLLRTANKQTPYWVAKPVRTRFFCTRIKTGASAHGDGCDTVDAWRGYKYQLGQFMEGVLVSTDLRVTLISHKWPPYASASDRSKLKREARFICITIKCLESKEEDAI